MSAAPGRCRIRWRLEDADHEVTLVTDAEIGRSSNCAVRITASDRSILQELSRRHARVFVDGGRWLVEDLGSRNGVERNGRRVEREPLEHGDTLALGSVVLRVELPDRGGEPSAPVEIRETEEIEAEHTLDMGALDTLLAGAEPAAPSAPRAPTDTAREVDPSAVDGFGGGAWIGRLFYEAAEGLQVSESLDAMLARVLELVFAHLPVQRATLCTLDGEGGAPRQRATRTLEGTSADPIRISSRIVGDAVERRQSVLVQDTGEDAELAASGTVAELGIRAAMCAPLYRDGLVEGFLYVDRQTDGRSFDKRHLVVLSTLAILTAVALEQTRLRDRLEAERRHRERLSRYHSPEVVERILLGEGAAMLAETVEITVLFADLQGFTRFSEGRDPVEVVSTLNRIFERVTEEILVRNGTLDKFQGDGIMAFFGAPLYREGHAERAVEAGLAMQAALGRMQGEGPSLGMRIGVHTGVAVVGDIGSAKRKDFTAIGETVNTASRLESTVARAGDVVVGDSTWERVRDLYEGVPLPPVLLKGMRRELRPFRVTGRMPATEGIVPSE